MQWQKRTVTRRGAKGSARDPNTATQGPTYGQKGNPTTLRDIHMHEIALLHLHLAPLLCATMRMVLRCQAPSARLRQVKHIIKLRSGIPVRDATRVTQKSLGAATCSGKRYMLRAVLRSEALDREMSVCARRRDGSPYGRSRSQSPHARVGEKGESSNATAPRAPSRVWQSAGKAADMLCCAAKCAVALLRIKCVVDAVSWQRCPGA